MGLLVGRFENIHLYFIIPYPAPEGKQNPGILGGAAEFVPKSQTCYNKEKLPEGIVWKKCAGKTGK